MIIDKVSGDQSKLTVSLMKHLRSLSKPNVNITCVGHTSKVGSIAVTVTGKHGTVSKYFSIFFDEFEQEWQLYSEGYCYKMLMLSEMGIVIKSSIQKMRTILGKIS